ncbi:hypothetical protein [Hyphomicrobium sp.]|uniref:hypothetical protein n=1 Tax=Hyphomicrobium sp. TaxID=82 RepID=UPI000FC39D54|nr:hypothetical protein [Hyphomicrobium sp.]RUO98699.1 MAG: hypothetical protein EKK30_10825 [Hyphomicrobium sp.]
MVNSTESIGRLITEEVLLQSERQLLQNRDRPSQQAKQQQPQPAPTPLSYNDKAVSSILLTLLDEQLDASVIAPKEQMATTAEGQKAAGEAQATPNRVAVQYAEAEAAFRAEDAVPLAQVNPQVMATSPELRMLMESAFVTAASRLQAGSANVGNGEERRRKAQAQRETALFRIGAGVFAGALLVMVIAAIFSR